MPERNDDARKGGGSARGGFFRNSLVVAEVALSLILLVGAGLLMRSFINLQSVALGYDAEPVLFVRMTPLRGQYATAPARRQFLRELLSRMQAVPCVTAATTSTSLPPHGGIGMEIDIPGKPQGETHNSIMQLVGQNYFKTLGPRLLRGRLLGEFDVNDARKVIVVNQAMVAKYFGDDDPVGQHIQFKRLGTLPNARAEDSVFEIVGVVSDAMNSGVRDPVWLHPPVIRPS